MNADDVAAIGRGADYKPLQAMLMMRYADYYPGAMMMLSKFAFNTPARNLEHTKSFLDEHEWLRGSALWCIVDFVDSVSDFVDGGSDARIAAAGAFLRDVAESKVVSASLHRSRFADISVGDTVNVLEYLKRVAKAV